MRRLHIGPAAVLVLLCARVPAARAMEGADTGYGWCAICKKNVGPGHMEKHRCAGCRKIVGPGHRCGSGGGGGATSPKAALVGVLMQELLFGGGSDDAAAREAELVRRRAEEARRRAKRRLRQAAKERARWDAEDDDLEGLVDAMGDTWDGGGEADSLTDALSDTSVVDLRPDRAPEPSPEQLARAKEEAEKLFLVLEQMALEYKDPEVFRRKLDELEGRLLEELKGQFEMQALRKAQANNEASVVDLRGSTKDAPALLREPEPVGRRLSENVEREPEEIIPMAEGKTSVLREVGSDLAGLYETATWEVRGYIDLLKGYSEIPKEKFLEATQERFVDATLGRFCPNANKFVELNKWVYETSHKVLPGALRRAAEAGPNPNPQIDPFGTFDERAKEAKKLGR